MTVENRRGDMDQFPVGLRVLAVDDDPTCLRMLEALLRRCQYNVTTTNQAITALKMLRENRDKFDLVISDVQMPDMDGFKLLELVGLEMDLPVIMMSGNGDTQNVMKGIAHGACDYLLKPVRMEELKNIWQHVIRKKKLDNKHRINVAEGEEGQNGQNSYSGSEHGSADNGNLNKKRKEHNEMEDDGEDIIQGNEDNANQKKLRVVWTVELHRKFVAAVNQLGIDRAVPKKILDHMNVENLTRENVASHLQKYRLYLKRLSTVASQQGSMATAMGGRSSYISMNPLNGYRNYHALGGSRQLPDLASFQSNGVLGGLNNNPPATGMPRSLTSQPVQFGDTLRNTSSSFGDSRNLQCINLPGNHQGTLLPGAPTTLELNRLQQPKIVQEVKSQLSASLSRGGVAYGLRGNSFAEVPNNPLMLRQYKQLNQVEGLSNNSFVVVPSSNSDTFKTGPEEFSQISNFNRCDNTWQGAVPSTGVSSNPLAMIGQVSIRICSPGSNVHNLSSATPHDNSLLGDPSCGMASAPQRDPMMSNQRFTGNMLALSEGENLSNIAIIDNSGQRWDDTFHSSHISRTSSSSSFPHMRVTDTTAEYQISESGLRVDQESFGTMDFNRNCAVGDSQLNYRDDFAVESSGWQVGLGTSGCSLDDLVNSMMKHDRDDGKQIDVDLVSDMYNLGTCM